MDSYDENLRENPFFEEIQSNHRDIIEKASKNNWILCIPRSGTIEGEKISSYPLILDHILINEYQNGRKSFTTLSKKPVEVVDRKIVIEESLFVSNIRILFEETFYIDKATKYCVWCLEKPLFYEKYTESQNDENLESIYDCIDFLWVESRNNKVLQEIRDMCLEFRPVIEECNDLDTLINVVGQKYSQCLRIALNNGELKAKSGEATFLEKLKIAVETYMQCYVGNKILFTISTLNYIKETNFNKVLQSKNMNYSKEIEGALKIIQKINSCNTILDKFKCLELTFKELHRSKENSVVNAETLIPKFGFLILKSEINNWLANLTFLKEFQFGSNNLNNFNNYLIATLEAALQYVKNKRTAAEDIFKDLKTHMTIFKHVETGDLYSVQNYFNENANNTQEDISLCHPLCSCPKCKDLNHVGLSLDINATNEKGQSLLIVATIYEQTPIIEFLLRRNCDTNIADSCNKTALHYAAQQGYQEGLLLLSSHAKCIINNQDIHGNTPLHLSCQNGHENCTKALIYSNRNVDLNRMNNCGNTPMHLASKWGFLPIVMILIENFASITIKNHENHTPHDLAHNNYVLKAISEFKTIEIIDQPMEETNETRAPSSKNCKQINLLLNAIENNDIQLSYFYLGFNLNKKESLDVSEKCHPLCTCSKCQIEEGGSVNDATEKQKTINVNNANEDGVTSLHVAVKYGNCTILQVLLDSRADINAKTFKEKYTPLHLACIHQRIEAVKLLLECSNCKINETDFLGNTPLFYVCIKNDCKLVELLINNDADCLIQNNEGKNVWDLCQENNSYEVFKILKNYFKNT